MIQNKVIVRNIICSLLLQIVTIISGFVIPKVILTYFGSNTNGLVSSLNQFLNYITLLEGGVSGVIMAGLYKPLAEQDYEKINGIIVATKRFFRKIAIIYIVYTLIVAVVYPCFVQTEYSKEYIFLLTIVLGVNIFVQYFFSLTYKLLLNADRKVYYVSIVQIGIVLLNMILIVLAVRYIQDILIIKLVTAIVFLIQPILYSRYVRKNYPLDRKALPNHEALKQRWDGFGQNLAFFVNTNVDIAVLTIFTGLTEVSVYSVYFMVVNALKNLVISISQAIAPSMGNVLAIGKKEEINNAFDRYEFIMQYITTLVFTCGILLLTPFVLIYTNGVTDANYNQPLFGILLAISQMVYCFRDPYISVTYIAGHFKQTSKYAYGEAVIKILVVTIVVYNFGLIGVAIGSVISMLYRMFVQVIYLRKNILLRTVKKFFLRVGVFGLSSLFTSMVYIIFFNYETYSYDTWIGKAIIVFVICISITTGLCCLFCKKDVCAFVNRKIDK